MVPEVAGSPSSDRLENPGEVERICKSESFRSLTDIQSLIFQQLNCFLNPAAGEKAQRGGGSQTF